MAKYGGRGRSSSSRRVGENESYDRRRRGQGLSMIVWGFGSRIKMRAANNAKEI